VRGQPSVEVILIIDHDATDPHVGAATAMHAELFQGRFGKAGIGGGIAGAQFAAVVLGCVGVHFSGLQQAPDWCCIWSELAETGDESERQIVHLAVGAIWRCLARLFGL